MHHFEAHELADSWEMRAGLLDADPADASISACLRECAAALRKIAVPCAAVTPRLAQALERELLRRTVTSLPHKVKLMERLGLESIAAVETWMVQTADLFEMAARDYLAAASHVPVQGSEP